MSALGILENFHCQGHNSLNLVPIFKMFVPNHISFPQMNFPAACVLIYP